MYAVDHQYRSIVIEVIVDCSIANQTPPLKLQACQCSVRPYGRQQVTPHHDRQRGFLQRESSIYLWAARPWYNTHKYFEMVQNSDGQVVIEIVSVSLLVGTGSSCSH